MNVLIHTHTCPNCTKIYEGSPDQKKNVCISCGAKVKFLEHFTICDAEIVAIFPDGKCSDKCKSLVIEI